MTGTGTQTDPYIITAAAELYEMETLGGEDVYFRLGADIDFNGTEYAENYVSIPLKCRELDGDGHVIRNIYSSDMSDKVSVFTLASNAQELKNLIFEEIYLTGKYPCFFSGSSSGTITMTNCTVSCHFKATSVVENSTYSYFSLMNSSTAALNFELCTLIVKADLLKPYPIVAKGSANRTQFRLDYTALNSAGSTLGRFCLVYGVNMSDSYFFGKVSQTLGTGEEVIVFASGGSHSNCYQVVEYEKFGSAHWDSMLSSPCFYDAEVAGEGKVINTLASGYYPENLYGLTTAQCRDAEYLKSIGFLCEGAD